VTDDRVYLVHIADCIARIESYTSEGKVSFFSSTLIQDAVIRNLQTLSESTQRISVSLKAASPSVEWRNISAFRNVIVHNYLGIDLNQIWAIVESDLPELKLQIERILREMEGETSHHTSDQVRSSIKSS
jgi:uncharacterized protein with HEPN domain